MLNFNTVAWAIVCVVAILAIYILDKFDKKASKNWELIAAGIYDRVVYGYYKETRGGGMGSRRHTYKMDVTVIYFKDGTTCVMDGRYDIILPRGTRISISRNGRDEYRIKETR